MKKYSLLLVIVALVSTMIGCAREPQVQMKELEVAVVNQSRLWEESVKAEKYQEQLNDKVEELKEKYNTEIDNLSETKNSNQQQEIYEEINDYREELKEKFKQDMAQAVEKIAEEEGYDVVFNKEEVKFGGEDITEEVLEEF